jgi:hypothetical protein
MHETLTSIRDSEDGCSQSDTEATGVEEQPRIREHHCEAP